MKKTFFLLFVSLALNAAQDIDTIMDAVTATLKKNSPAAHQQFEAYKQQYAESVRVFFDKNDDQPLAEHCKIMEKNLKTLHTVCHDKNYASVKKQLLETYEKLYSLYETTKSYIGSHNSVGFALALRRFRFFLTGDIKKRSLFHLFGCLNHRLYC